MPPALNAQDRRRVHPTLRTPLSTPYTRTNYMKTKLFGNYSSHMLFVYSYLKRKPWTLWHVNVCDLQNEYVLEFCYSTKMLVTYIRYIYIYISSNIVFPAFKMLFLCILLIYVRQLVYSGMQQWSAKNEMVWNKNIIKLEQGSQTQIAPWAKRGLIR